jgi:S1-C subfamily serine protease
VIPRAAVVVLVLLGTAVPPLAADQASPAATLVEVESAVVQIVTVRRDSETRVARGSAFYITPDGDLLTCAHVIDHLPGDEARRLRLRDGSERPFEVVAVDREVDVALLRSVPSERYLVLAEAAFPRTGDAVVLAGYAVRGPEPDGGPRFKPGAVTGLERRRISGARREVSSRRTILNVRVDTIADAGQSGGPLLDAGSNAAVGIIRANLERVTGGLEQAPPQGNAVAVPLVYVLPFVRRFAK